MAEKGFKLKLNTIIKGYGHSIPHCISSAEIPTFKIRSTIPYKLIDSVTEHQAGRNFIGMKIHQCRFEETLGAPNYMTKGGGEINIFNGESSLTPMDRIISKGGKNHDCFFWNS